MLRDKTKNAPLLYLAACAKCPCLLLCCLLIISLFTTPAVAEDILVVTQQDTPVSSLSYTEVANLFLGLGQNNHGLTAFDLSDKELRKIFYREITGLSLASIRAKRAKQVFTGRGRPPAMLKPVEVGQLLSENPGAVTYISADQLPVGSKVLLTLKTGGQK